MIPEIFWRSLTPSATVGKDISVKEAGFCSYCDQPFKDGDTWVMMAAYEGRGERGQASVETTVVHDSCSQQFLEKKQPLTVREAARQRRPLGGTDAQALEGALQQTEKELASARAQLAVAIGKLVHCECAFSPRDSSQRGNIRDIDVEKLAQRLDPPKAPDVLARMLRTSVEDMRAVLGRDYSVLLIETRAKLFCREVEDVIARLDYRASQGPKEAP